MKQKQFAPDPESPASASSVTTVHSVPGIPQKDVDFMDVSRAVAATWLASPAITLVYTTAQAFSEQVQRYTSQLTTRISTGSSRPSQTQSLSNLDTAIDKAVKEVKVYIQKKFGTGNATAEFPRYGIIKEASAYRLPRDRDKRLAALDQMMDAINRDRFGAEEYGQDFWAGAKSSYNQSFYAANSTDGNVSTGVANKNNLKKEINKVMKSLRRVIEGNYPDSYKAIYRQWGWQKEDY